MLIVSEKLENNKKFIFFHLYKVAGSSIALSIDKYKDVNLTYRFNPHTPPSELIEKVGMNFYNDYYKFAFVRNPWDWQVSLYHFMMSDRTHFQHNIIKNMTFDQYINWRVNEDFNTEYSFLSERGDNESPITLDFIGKFENIENDLKYVCDHLGIDYNLPHVNKSNHKHYKEYYSKESWDLIAKYAKKDIEYFGYEEEY